MFEQLNVKCIANNVLMAFVSPLSSLLSLQVENKELQVEVKTL